MKTKISAFVYHQGLKCSEVRNQIFGHAATSGRTISPLGHICFLILMNRTCRFIRVYKQQLQSAGRIRQDLASSLPDIHHSGQSIQSLMPDTLQQRILHPIPPDMDPERNTLAWFMATGFKPSVCKAASFTSMIDT